MKNRITLFWLNTPRSEKEQQSASLTIAYLAQVLQKHGIDVVSIDGNQVFSSEKLLENPLFCFRKLLMIVERTNPTVLGIGSWTVNMPVVIEFAKHFKARNPHVLVVLGGYNPTIIPEKTLNDFPFFDVLVRGEGEYTLLELMQKIESGENWHKIKGIAYRKNGKIILTEKRQGIQDLDKLPLLDFSSFRYLRNKANFQLLTSRGCYFNCSYCSQKSMWNKLNSHSNGYIVKQVRLLRKKYGDINISFRDDHFLCDKNKFKQLFLKFRQADIFFSWSSLARIDVLDKETVDCLIKYKCKQLFVGLESIIPHSLRFYNKTSQPLKYLEDAYDTFNYLANKKIQVQISTIIGSPYETKGDILKMVDYLVKLNKIDNFSAYTGPLVPYIGTYVWNLYLGNKIKIFRIADENLRRNTGGFFHWKYDKHIELVPNAFSIKNFNMTITEYCELIERVLKTVGGGYLGKTIKNSARIDAPDK